MTLREALSYEPQVLRFGTSGRRGLIVDLTHLEIYINVRAELEYLESLSLAGDALYIARDLRPSSPSIAQAVVKAAQDAGMTVVNLDELPTPALMHYAVARSSASIMVTGSHIPFDRNGYKLNTSRGELLKQHEAPINAKVAEVRETLCSQPFECSLFDATGHLRTPVAIPAPLNAGIDEYLARYTNFFGATALKGLRVLVYQHSSVGRDALVDLMRGLGAEVVTAGRSDEFVPIDTEAIGEDQLALIQSLVDAEPGHLDAVVSADGDCDRPLLLGLDANRHVSFFGGDLLGMITAEFLGADAVVVPISCNDAIDRGPLAPVLEPKTKIGSPFVIAGMEAAIAKGRHAVCGWEANGGFLLGSAITREGRRLEPLPTRDAFLPLAAVLSAAAAKHVSVNDLFGALPKRFSRSGLLRNFPRATGLRIVESMSEETLSREVPGIARIDRTDGLRMILTNGEVIHLRPSGNADEFRCYAVADSAERAAMILGDALVEPDGLVRRLERSLEK